MEYSNEEYGRYLKEKSPNSSLAKDMFFAFVIGGLICVMGQAVYNFYNKALGIEEDFAGTCLSMTMVFFGALLTGLNFYGKIAKYAGAGTIVPITGFANAIVSSAMEFKKEGLVLGLAAKMFTIAGPVLVYGITASAAAGIIYWFVRMIWLI